MFKKLLIANRGEIAVRIIRTARRLGIRTLAVYSDADAGALHVARADEACRIGPAPASQSYLDGEVIIAVAKRCRAEAIHPGYGFLAENPEFAEAVVQAGLAFVGPPARAIRAMGLKDEAKRLMERAGVPLLPGYHGSAQDLATLTREARRIGFPVLVKPVAGGGGKGMRRVAAAADLERDIEAGRREAIAAFGDGRLMLEKFVTRARHIEVQIMADAHGNMVHLFERDCSLQRRHQKVIEESPAPDMTGGMREKLCAAALAAARSVGYVGAGTVEFLADVSGGLTPERFYFLEMNTRLQVEHPVTECVTGLDLVELQLRVAAGEALTFSQSDVKLNGHAIEARLYAEDAARDFQPQTGRLTHFSFPADPPSRLDTGVEAGDAVSPHYDPLLAKLIVHAATRAEAVARLATVLARGQVAGCTTNLTFLNRLIRHPAVAAGDVDTGLIGEALQPVPRPPMVVLAAAMLLTAGHLQPPRGISPFATLTGFRLWGGEAIHASFGLNGKSLEYMLERDGTCFIVKGGGQSLRFSLLSFDSRTLRLDCGERIETLWYFMHDGLLSVARNGERYDLGLTGGPDASADRGGSGLIVSPVPGLVRKILVVPGEQVRHNAVLAIVEAMKMEFSLKADRDGEVIEINASEGAQIAEGTVLLTIGDARA